MGDSAIQILKYNRTKKSFELEEEALERILYDNDVKECSIAIVSIAGAFRKGKSFLLSFFLRYLNAEYVQNNSIDWLGGDETPLAGFSWRGGSERHTTGIWIWSKVFTKILPSGEKIGVMLMDTQGTFDSNSTMKDNVTIFSLSTMLSSVQIYNLFHNIQEDDLQHLQLFTEYGKLAMDESSHKAFQKLLFLVRDWSYPYEHAYGSLGGKNLLTRKLEVTDDQAEELTYVRTHLRSCYEDLDCFLMPHPGNIATIAQYFTGQLRDIDDKFKASLRELVPMLLAPQNVLTKKINGEKIKGKNLLAYIESYWKIFNKGGIPNAQTILGATAEANNLSAKDEANEHYQTEMRKITASDKEMLEFGQMVEHHDTISKQALDMFRAKAVMGDEKVKTFYYNKLYNELQGQLMLFLGQNEAKKTKDLNETIGKLSDQINNYRATNEEQAAVMNSLKEQMDSYRLSSEEEKRRLRDDIERMRHEMNSNRNSGRGGGGCSIL